MEFFRKERLSFLVSQMGIPGFIHRWVVRKGAFSNRKLGIDLLIGLVQAVENGAPGCLVLVLGLSSFKGSWIICRCWLRSGLDLVRY